MVTVKIQLDKSRAKSNGTYPVVLRVNHKGQFRVSLNTSVHEDQFEDGQIVNHPKRIQLNNFLNRSLQDALNLIFDLRLVNRLDALSNADLKALIENKPIEKKETKFIEARDLYKTKTTRPNSLSLISSMCTRLGKFSDTENLLLKDINLAFLKDFDIDMTKSGLSPNSRGTYFSKLKAIYNDAIDRELIGLEHYPFRRFKLPKAETKKRSLDIEDIRKIRDCELSVRISRARDVFMLMFYLMGINLIDLAHLKKIEKGRIEFIRAKTGKRYSMLVVPEAMEIINRYKGKDYLIDLLEYHKNFKAVAGAVRQNLEVTAKKALGGDPLTTYYSRHSWATIAAGLEIPKETIAAALGHSSMSVTDVYIKFDNKKVDEANRRVIDCLLEK